MLEDENRTKYGLHETHKIAEEKINSSYWSQVQLYPFLAKKNRYKGSSKFQLTSDMYPKPEENLAKVLEIARELYWEAKRAP